MTNDGFISENQLRKEFLPVSRSTLWRWERDKNGDFPKRRRLGPGTNSRRVGWLRSEIEEYIKTCPVASVG